MEGYLLANRSLPWWAVGPVGDGHAVERDHARRHDRAGLRRRHALHPVLLRSAAGDGRAVGHPGAVLLSRRRLHRLRIPRAPLRREDAHAGQPALPLRTEHVDRRHHLGARRHPVDHLPLEPDVDDPGDRRSDDHLHDARRRAGGDLDRRQADGDRRRRTGVRGRGVDPRPAAGGRRRPGAPHRRRRRPHEHHRLPLRPAADLHVLVGHHRRALPAPVLLRLRSEPGAAIPDGEIAEPGAALAADERVCQDPAPGARADGRCLHVPVLRVQPAADAVQHRARRQDCGERAGRRIPPARGRVRRELSAAARRGDGDGPGARMARAIASAPPPPRCRRSATGRRRSSRT